MASTSKTGTRTPGEIARTSFEQLFKQRDLSDPGRYWSDHVTNHFIALGTDVSGKHQLATFFHELFAAFPDFEMDVQNIIDDGERHAAVQWTARGTFSGARWQGFEPTGSRIEIRGIDAIRFDADGKIEENTVYYDGAAFARQVGLLPPAGSTADRAVLTAFNGATALRKRFRRT